MVLGDCFLKRDRLDYGLKLGELDHHRMKVFGQEPD
jgi:hypothetical protein